MILSPNALVHPDVVQADLERLPESIDQTISFINRASKIIEDRCRRHFRRGTHTVTVDGTGTDTIILPYRPIHAVDHLYVDTLRVFGADTEVAATDFNFIYDRIYYATDVTEKSVKIVMDAGYDIIRFRQTDEPADPTLGDIWFDGTNTVQWNGATWDAYVAYPMPFNIENATIEYVAFMTRRILAAEVGVLARDFQGGGNSLTFESVMPRHILEMLDPEIFYG